MTEIKICGITNRKDALAAAACGADAVGFIFHAPSPRYVTPETAREIALALPAGIAKVGVFVNGEADEVRRTAYHCRLDFIQLHGDESPDFCELFPPEKVIKAVFLQTPEDLPALKAYEVRAFLVDARGAGLYGGTGKCADWGLAAQLAKTHPLILAGGLDAANVVEAVRAVGPAAVDINSGCERLPGIKDHDRLRRIVGLIQGASAGGPRAIFTLPVRGTQEPASRRSRPPLRRDMVQARLTAAWPPGGKDKT
jgi:phosphoribosylanthranilate isomerase